MSATESLKALARRVLERDSQRDGERDSLSRSALSGNETPRYFSPLPIVSAADGEPSLEQPCAARRGRVVALESGAFLHFCCRCGRFAAFGYGVRLRAGRPGR